MGVSVARRIPGLAYRMQRDGNQVSRRDNRHPLRRVDHIPVHHTNEIAQSETATGKKFANYWLHNEFMLVDGKKMSKSLGNYYTLSDIIAKGFSLLAFRYLCMSVHYRSQMNFTLAALQDAENAVKAINDFIFRLSRGNDKLPKNKKI